MEAAGRSATNVAIVRPNAETIAWLIGGFDFSWCCLSQGNISWARSSLVLMEFARGHAIYEGHKFIMHRVKGWDLHERDGFGGGSGNRWEVQ